MILIDGFHRLEAAKKRGDKEIEVQIKDISHVDALAAKLNTTHGKRLTVLEPAGRIKLFSGSKGLVAAKSCRLLWQSPPWFKHYINIAKNLDSTIITRVINLDYASARELAKLPQNKQAQAYHLAQNKWNGGSNLQYTLKHTAP